MKDKIELMHDGENKISYIFYCPGCKCHHMYYIKGYNISWQFNGNLQSPTFTPSLRVNYGNGKVCHLFVTNGKIEYCSDSFHELKGKQIEMEDIEL